METTKGTDVRINYGGLPRGLVDGMQLYIERGVPTGSFLKAAICNNLTEAFGRADEINTAHMKDIATFLYNQMPIGSWGSENKYDDWCAGGGLLGRQ